MQGTTTTLIREAHLSLLHGFSLPSNFYLYFGFYCFIKTLSWGQNYSHLHCKRHYESYPTNKVFREGPNEFPYETGFHYCHQFLRVKREHVKEKKNLELFALSAESDRDRSPGQSMA